METLTPPISHQDKRFTFGLIPQYPAGTGSHRAIKSTQSCSEHTLAGYATPRAFRSAGKCGFPLNCQINLTHSPSTIPGCTHGPFMTPGGGLAYQKVVPAYSTKPYYPRQRDFAQHLMNNNISQISCR